MGACDFSVISGGKNAQDAFNNAVSNARYEYGHSGYTGSIAEKDSFVEISLPDGKSASEYSGELMDNDDSRVSDKWGPAGCIKVKEDVFLFFGLASS